MKKYIHCMFLILPLLTQHIVFAQTTPQLIGFTSGGGANNLGVMYKINPDGTAFTPVYSFAKATGYTPSAAPMVNTSKNVNIRYSMCQKGGAHDSGCIFSYDVVKNKYTDLFDFSDSTGGFPEGGLILATNGLLYGVTYEGGRSINGNPTHGTLFSFNPNSKKFQLLFYFQSQTNANPYCTLLQGADGKLYGTAKGIAGSSGEIFSYNILNGVYVQEYNQIDAGYYPGALVQDNSGIMYGYGALKSNNEEIIFVYKFNPVTKFTHTIWETGFNPTPNYNAYNALTFDLNKSNLLGTATANSTSWIFSIAIKDSSYHLAYTFQSNLQGYGPGSLINRNPNNYYGVTDSGGAYNLGVMYHYYPQLGGYAKLHDFTGNLGGSNPYGLLTGVACTQHPAKPGTIMGSASVKCNKTIKYYIKRVTGATAYIWTVPAGATIQGSSTDTAISVLWGTTGGDITVQASNTCGVSGKQIKTITVTCTAKESITSDAVASTANGVTPNPTTGNATLHFTSDGLLKYTINIVDVTGKILLMYDVNAVHGDNSRKLDLSKFAKGMYYIQLKSENDTKVFKVVLQ
ncbi:MAG TPA: choice-of-anchor tandem repeat GloVer-containing protein [Parafilimonas sp.]|nr:choice-of-anchor tandem repeat GloVer-containing protein [Parafilimonas sp.]